MLILESDGHEFSFFAGQVFNINPLCFMPVMRCPDCGHEFKQLFGFPRKPIKCKNGGLNNMVVVQPM